MIEIKNLSKSFGPRKITDDLNLTINDGEFIAIIGRSGEGKSVLLKQIVGLIKPDSGQVLMDNIDVTKLKGQNRDLIYQKCGYVFQFAALLDSLNIFENIGLPLLEKGISEKSVRPIVLEKIRNVGLREDILDKFPDELSGGMKKRVGLARTLMLKPKNIIYDEPTTGLDPITTKVIHDLMKKTQLEQKTTTIVISHDIEIFKFADRVAMLNGGKIVYIGSAKTIWETDNPYIYQFIRGLKDGPLTTIDNK